MADLSAVLRKTIDGLTGATPQTRAKVYEKARAAIGRQIDAANPPLSDDVVEARRNALEDAIARTEAHYEALDISGGAQSPAAETVLAAPAPAVADPKTSALQKPAWPKAGDPAQSAAAVSAPPPDRPDQAVQKSTDIRPSGPMAAPRYDATEPHGGLDEAAIPEADFAAPRYGSGQRRSSASSPRSALLAGLAVVLLGAGGVLAYVYLDDIRELLDVGTGETVAAAPASPSRTVPVPVNVAPSALPETPSAPDTVVPATSEPDASSAPPAAPAVTGASPPAVPAAPPEAAPAVAGAPQPTPEIAALPAAPLPGAAVLPAAPKPPIASDGPPAAGPGAPPGAATGRRFTQRLMPDGTEIDAGPGPSNANAFNEGTNVAAASPEPLDGIGAALPTASVVPEETAASDVDPAATPPEAAPPPLTPSALPMETAALPPDGVNGAVPAVAQKAVFYEERSETEAGTQLGGNVVWSVVNEPPSEGQPSEPAIRAIADVPQENLRLTLTIRRNADATLPASHVIELMFDTPPNFAGGSIANVQRLALKPTEQARGEPLIGVAGKISEGFFIIALNNLTQATDTNLELLSREQWIDIPLAYATGRRALMSIEKGIPGERVFKEAMDAWAAKT